MPLGIQYRLFLLTIVAIAVLPNSVFSSEIQVPSQYPTIQTAIDASQNGDVIIVQPGVYSENINFNGKAITLISTNPLDSTIVANTIIDGGMNGSVVTFDSSETPNSILTGFTIRNGGGTLIDGKRYGGGIFCGLHATPTIRRNKIINNTADVGGGIYTHGNSPPVITNGPNADYPYANKGQIVGLSVTATDPDGDTLVYRWVPREGGAISGTGATVSFSAATAGVYHIDLTVDDQHGGKATGTVTVTAIGITIQAVPQLKVGQSSSISAVATPLIGNTAEYPVSITWSVTQGPAAGTFDAGVNGTPGATSINFTPTASGPGRIQVVYQVGMVSTSHSLAIALNPIVSSIDIGSGIQNSTVQPVLTGNNLGRVSSVSLSGSGVTASIRDGKTENSLPVQFVIDKEAAAGNRTISLTTPENTFSTSLTFQIIALPAITANPTSLNIVVGNTGPIVFSIPSPAPSGGLTLTLSSSAPSVATIPASATIPQGQTSVQVNVTAVAFGTTTITADTAIYSKAQVPVTVLNVPIMTFSPSPLTVPLGVTVQCTVDISNPAPTGGLVVTLTGGSGKIEIPATVTIPASQKSVAFSIKGLAEGTSTVTATATGYPSADLQVNVAALALINCGQTVGASITAAGQKDSYYLTVSANDTVTIRTSRTSGSVQPYLELYNAAGSLVATGNGLYNSNGYQIDKKLTAAGTYTLVVRDVNNSATGNYLLYWERVNSPCNVVAVLNCGEPLTGSLGATADNPRWKAYSFIVPSAETVRLYLTATSGNFYPYADLYNAAGTFITTVYYYSTVDVSLAAGTYTLIVRDSYNQAVGNFTLEWQKPDGTCP